MIHIKNILKYSFTFKFVLFERFLLQTKKFSCINMIQVLKNSENVLYFLVNNFYNVFRSSYKGVSGISTDF